MATKIIGSLAGLLTGHAGALIMTTVGMIKYKHGKADKVDKLKAKFSKFDVKSSLEAKQTTVSKFNSFIEGRNSRERKALNKLRWVKSYGEHHDYSFYFDHGSGHCDGLLVIVAKKSEDVSILFCRVRIDFELAEGSKGISSTELNDIFEEYIKREAKRVTQAHIKK